MKERPIPFSAPMVRALLEGRKTQTRRMVKEKDFSPEFHASCPAIGVPRTLEKYFGTEHVRMRFGVPGDRLWVRERIELVDTDGHWAQSCYAADGSLTKADAWPWKRNFLPPMHCPRGLSRITLCVTSVRIERLKDITDEDARAEGFPLPDAVPATVNGAPGTAMFFDARAAFAYLWDQLNGRDLMKAWQSNPWVWVVGFEREVAGT